MDSKKLEKALLVTLRSVNKCEMEYALYELREEKIFTKDEYRKLLTNGILSVNIQSGYWHDLQLMDVMTKALTDYNTLINDESYHPFNFETFISLLEKSKNYLSRKKGSCWKVV